MDPLLNNCLTSWEFIAAEWGEGGELAGEAMNEKYSLSGSGIHDPGEPLNPPGLRCKLPGVLTLVDTEWYLRVHPSRDLD